MALSALAALKAASDGLAATQRSGAGRRLRLLRRRLWLPTPSLL